MSLIDDINRDREMMVGTGTFGQWWGDEETRTVTLKDNVLITVADVEDEIDTRRIARVPDMEAALLAADAMANAADQLMDEAEDGGGYTERAAIDLAVAIAAYREATK